MNYQQIYSEVDTIVTRYRKELEDAWATPSAGDCIKFAVTEAAEVIDAELRQNPMYARNNDKVIDPLDEVADCLMMLVSANQQQGYLYVNANDSGYLFSGSTMLVIECGAALDKFESEGGTSLNRPITVCLQLLGEDAPKRVENRLKRIKVKASGRKRMVIDSPVTLAAKKCPEIQNTLTMIEMGTMTESDALREMMIKYAAMNDELFSLAIDLEAAKDAA